MTAHWHYQENRQNTTQCGSTPVHTILKSDYKYPSPILNVCYRHEIVATGTVYYDTHGIDDWATLIQIFVGTDTLLTGVRGMKSDN